MPTDIILYALIAAGLVLWLRNILGTRHGEERDRVNPFTTPLEKAEPAQKSTESSDNVVSIHGDLPPIAVLPRYFTISETADEMLPDITKADKTFDLVHFAQGAADAFAYVVEAFADGDRDALKDLLAPPVYKAFEATLKEREACGETVETEIHAVRKVELKDARVRDKMIYLKLHITADETCVIRDKEGVIISGDPDRVTEMVDMWTFGRPVKSKDPRWLVYETSDGDVVEDHKTPVPDSHA